MRHLEPEEVALLRSWSESDLLEYLKQIPDENLEAVTGIAFLVWDTYAKLWF